MNALRLFVSTSLGRLVLTTLVCSGFVAGAGAADYSVTTGGNAIVLTDNSANNDVLTITEPSAGTIQFAAPGRSFSIDGGPDTFSNSGPVSLTNITIVTVNAAGGNDLINVGAFSATLPSVTINAGSGNGAVNLSGNLTFATNANLDLNLQDDDNSARTDDITVASGVQITTSGTGSITMKVSRAITINSGAALTTVNGGITIEANQQPTATTDIFAGVTLDGASVTTSGSGNISIKGKGGAGSTDDPLYGIWINTGGLVTSTSTTVGAGTITLSGTGGAGQRFVYGVRVNGAGTKITAAAGDISITGFGSPTGTGLNNFGVYVFSGAAISSTNGAKITVNGTGGGGTGAEIGVFVSDNGSMITSTSGDISVTGQGGTTATGGSNKGIGVSSGGAITSTAGAKITLNGTGGSGTSSSIGVDIGFSSSNVTSSTGDISITGNGGAGTTGSGNLGVSLASTGNVTSTAGAKITLNGTGGGGTDTNCGVKLTGANTKVASSTGDISVTGQGSSSTTTIANDGVAVFSGAGITSSNGAKITVNGTGGSGSSNNTGVELNGSGASISSSTGAVSITGQGRSTTSGASNAGIGVFTGGVISSTGSATVTLDGTGGGGTDTNYGVVVSASSSAITSSGGAVSVTGHGSANATGQTNCGVALINASAITGSGSANVTLNGTGGAAGSILNHGVLIQDANTLLTTVDGTLSITGAATRTNSYGVYLGSGSEQITTTGTGSLVMTGGATGQRTVSGNPVGTCFGIEDDPNGGATITIKGQATFVTDSFDLTHTSTNAGANAVTLRPKTNGTAIDVGGNDAPGTLGLSPTELAQITSGPLIIGDANSGTITLNSGVGASSVQLISGADIVLGPGGIFSLGSVVLTSGVSGSVQPTVSGVDVTASSLSFGSGTRLGIAVNGTALDSQYTQLNVASDTVNLTGVSLIVSGSYKPVLGDSFTVLVVGGSNPITGTFTGLAEGASVNVNGTTCTITYKGGSGNDVVLAAPPASSTPTPTPGSTATPTATATATPSATATPTATPDSRLTASIFGNVTKKDLAVGEKTTETATVSSNSGATPTGTVTLALYGPNNASCSGSPVFQSTQPISKINNVNAAFASVEYGPTAAGNYLWVATYSGDSNYLPNATSCGDPNQAMTVREANATPTPSPTATPTATPTPTPAQALNIATRLRVDTGENVMIAGFIITGNADKAIVLRGRGPSLAAFGINNPLLDPVLELHGPNGSLITRNDNWKDDQRSQIEGTIFQPSDDRESVILATVSPTFYTAVLTGKDNTTGVGIVEVFDNNQGADSQLAQISTRGLVEGGNSVMIAGFILGGTQNPTHVAIRGIGPSLTQFGISHALPDPTLELHDGNGATLISNDNWDDDSVSAAELSVRNLAPSNPKESAIFTSLPAGQFTAILAGKGGGTGVGIIEVYNLK